MSKNTHEHLLDNMSNVLQNEFSDCSIRRDPNHDWNEQPAFNLYSRSGKLVTRMNVVVSGDGVLKIASYGDSDVLSLRLPCPLD